MASRTTPALPVDRTAVEHSFVRGLVTDSADIPSGGVAAVTDFMVDRPGLLYKRGGWTRHSASLGGQKALWISALNVPPKVAAIDTNFDAWDVTTAGSALSIGNVGFAPLEHSSQYVNMVVLCDPAAAVAPKKISWNGTNLVVADFGGTPPKAAFSTVYAGRVVLGRGATVNDLARLYFSELPDVEATWDPLKFIDTSFDITGLAAVGGVLLIFSAQHVERILGGVPPAEQGSDMQLQPVAGVGCLDARSIVLWDNSVIFAGEEGVWFSNGAGVESLIEKTDGTGIQVLWRSLFPRDQKRFIIGGLFNRDFYLVSICDTGYSNNTTLLCHLPSRAWTVVTNVNVASLAQARTAQGVLELYAGDAQLAFVNRVTSILDPAPENCLDGDGRPVEPTVQTRPIDGDTPTLKAYGFGRVSYNLNIGGFPGWQASHAYPPNTVIVVSGHLFKATTGGTSGPTFPPLNPVYGQTTPDGSVVWTCLDPQVTVSRVTEIGEETTTFSRDVHVLRLSDRVARDRFQLFGDYQSLSLKFAQRGPTAHTVIHYVEVEVRPYGPQADFNTGPEFGDAPVP